jgi:hypothetical protein
MPLLMMQHTAKTIQKRHAVKYLTAGVGSMYSFARHAQFHDTNAS